MKMPTNLAVNYESSALSESGNDQINCLLVEDDRFDRITFKRLNSRSNLNMNVFEACSIGEARDLLSEERVDILALDNTLPDGLGMVLSRELRNVKKYANLPIVMISGARDPQFVTAALDAGCTAVIDKGELTSESLEEIIKSAIRDSNPDRDGTFLSPEQMDAAMRQFTSDSVMDLNAPVLRLIRLSRKLQKQINDRQTSEHSSTAAEIEAVSYSLQRQLNNLITENQPAPRTRQ